MSDISARLRSLNNHSGTTTRAAADHIDALEASNKALVEALERIAYASDVYGVEANAEDQGADRLAYAHRSICNLARAAIAAVKETE